MDQVTLDKSPHLSLILFPMEGVCGASEVFLGASYSINTPLIRILSGLGVRRLETQDFFSFQALHLRNTCSWKNLYRSTKIDTEQKQRKERSFGTVRTGHLHRKTSDR